MKVICTKHKICALVECPHKISHDINFCKSIYCTTLLSCVCAEDVQHTRKIKIEEINKKYESR